MKETKINIPRGNQPLPIRNGLNPSRVRLPQEAHPQTALEFLTHCITTQHRRHPNDNESSIQNRFQKQEVIIGPKFRIATPNSQIHPGEDLWFYRIPAPETPIPYQCEIIYEDHNILVAYKPHFLATMPRARHITETATVRLRKSTGNNHLVPAHRLDRLTAGLLLFTKQPHLRGAYQTLFAAKKVQKTYQAIAPTKNITAGTHWHSRIHKEHGIICSQEIPGPPNAHTEVLNVEKLPTAIENTITARYALPGTSLSCYTLRPHTGKTHQLRVHMNSAGIPIVGDPFYPILLPDEPEDLTKPLLLTNIGIEFNDPLTGEQREFWLPESYATAITPQD